jgi:mannosyltransferase OCH1-like enzyme
MNFVNKQQLLKEKRKEQEEKRKEQEEKRKEIINQNKIDNEKIIHYNSLQKPFRLKSSYNSIIPLDLYTCWHTKDLPPLMKSNYDLLVQGNPKIKFHLFDEEDCCRFISENFDAEVLDAYDRLIPCAYKADLWRYCVLYINGGIYMDIKYQCANGFKFISLTEKEHFVKDRPESCVYNALIVSLPKNEILLKCIQKIVENVKNNYYGNNALYPTGPGLLGSFLNDQHINQLNMYFTETKVENRINEFYIVYNDITILKYYKGYREEQSRYQQNSYYTDLWNNKNIYR